MKARTGIITGGASGIGRCIAENLAAMDIKIALIDIDESAIENTLSEIRARGGDGTAYRVDVTDESKIEKSFSDFSDRCGGIDVLVNSAGVNYKRMAEDMTVAEWRRVIDINLTGTFICCKAAMPHMMSKKFGRMINVVSTAAKRISFNGGIHYTASKAGLLGLIRHLGYELAPYGITVNGICPGATATPLMESHMTQEEQKKRVDYIPMGRVMVPQDQANLVRFLISDEAEAITGQAIDVDGGSLLGWVDYESYRSTRKFWTSKGK